MLKSLLGIARQWSREKFAILTLKPRSHVRIFNISNVDYWRRCLYISEAGSDPAKTATWDPQKELESFKVLVSYHRRPKLTLQVCFIK